MHLPPVNSTVYLRRPSALGGRAIIVTNVIRNGDDLAIEGTLKRTGKPIGVIADQLLTEPFGTNVYSTDRYPELKES